MSAPSEPPHIPIFIIVHDRLKVLQQAIESYEKYIKTPFKIILHDVASTYPPCLQYLTDMKNKGYLLYRSEVNHHHTVMETVNQYLDEHSECQYYVITDPDIELDKVNGDILEFYAFLLEKYKAESVGPMLRIDDIPDHYPRKQNVIDGHGFQFWNKPFSTVEYKKSQYEIIHCDMDTTFQLRSSNNRKTNFPHSNSIRCNAPYFSRHLDWYINPETMTDDQIYYMNNASSISNWGNNKWSGHYHGKPIAKLKE